MIIKTPQQYVNQPDILQSAGESIAQFGKNALLIGGKTALTVIGGKFFDSLATAGVTLTIEQYHSYCTEEAIEQYVETAQRLKADIIIGAGGGKILDLAKAVGDQSQIPIITVPTIAATCAAWSALSILYDENGCFAGSRSLNHSPQLVLVDTRIISEAPVRFLRAGIADTLAKWYELTPYFADAESELALKIGLHHAKLAFNGLHEKGIRAIQDATNHHLSEVLREVIDSIIVLAGLVGSITEGSYHLALGHAIHNSLTFIPETHQSLHGEKVIFGVLSQLILQGKSAVEIAEFVTSINGLKLPLTLEQLGIFDVSKTAAEVKRSIQIDAAAFSKFPFPVSPELIEEAIIKANRIGKESLNKGGIYHEPDIMAI
ncbi:MAG TPA: glycerol dehydrogenase [Firmicutes bacterium]|jgi:glycerol dehydrogenase-like iron-containing ADH family enzyme|nr:glycerol dehydrogenase [Bacillota bacterium]